MNAENAVGNALTKQNCLQRICVTVVAWNYNLKFTKMTEKEFTELANKHLVVLESYQLDKEGNKQFNIFGYKQLYEAITVTHCCMGEDEQLLCSCDNPNGFKEMEEGRETCSKCKKPY